MKGKNLIIQKNGHIYHYNLLKQSDHVHWVTNLTIAKCGHII